MRLIRSLQDIVAPLPGAVVTIGNFDGVHLGHREIFRRVVARAREIDGTSVVLTFSPHPRKFLTPELAPRQITTDAEKEQLIAASCIDVLICVPFTGEIASLPAETFVREILCCACRCPAPDYRLRLCFRPQPCRGCRLPPQAGGGTGVYGGSSRADRPRWGSFQLYPHPGPDSGRTGRRGSQTAGTTFQSRRGGRAWRRPGKTARFSHRQPAHGKGVAARRRRVCGQGRLSGRPCSTG